MSLSVRGNEIEFITDLIENRKSLIELSYDMEVLYFLFQMSNRLLLSSGHNAEIKIHKLVIKFSWITFSTS